MRLHVYKTYQRQRDGLTVAEAEAKAAGKDWDGISTKVRYDVLNETSS